LNPNADEFEKSGLYGNETKDTVKMIRNGASQMMYGLRHHAKKHRWNIPEWDTDNMT